MPEFFIKLIDSIADRFKHFWAVIFVMLNEGKHLGLIAP